MTLYDGDTFTRQGLKFLVRINPDDMGPPWEEHDGHGPVRETYNYYGHPAKRPGERVLHSNRGNYWLYDWQAACKLARKDGWNAQPFDAPGRIERAVQADFDRLRGWLTDQWSWIGVEVKLLDDDGNEVAAESLCGIESDAGDYLNEVAAELADQIIAPRLKAWRSALADAKEHRRLMRLAEVMVGVLA